MYKLSSFELLGSHSAQHELVQHEFSDVGALVGALGQAALDELPGSAAESLAEGHGGVEDAA